MTHPFRDRCAIVGVGTTPYYRDSGTSTLSLALRAISAAVEDSGLPLSAIDGVACHRTNDSVQAAIVAEALGIRDLSFYLDQFGGGSVSHAVVAQACMAVLTGRAKYVVCWRAINARSENRMGGTGRPAPDTIEYQYQVPYGYATPPQQFAMMTRAYMAASGATEDDLGAVAVAQRFHATLNERAVMKQPMTLEDHHSSRWIVEPLRLLDCCLETDAAVAVIVTTAERAKDLRQVPVAVSAATFGPGANLISNSRPDIARSGAALSSQRLWAEAGLGPDDIDVAQIYDAFTPLVLLQLEDYGFCERGEAGRMVRDGVTRIGGRLPVNTHGGHLSAGYVHGLNHVMEAVEQLRWSAGERQVDGAEVALSTGQPGFFAGCNSALVLRRTS